jgi:hypothetical protein
MSTRFFARARMWREIAHQLLDPSRVEMRQCENNHHQPTFPRAFELLSYSCHHVILSFNKIPFYPTWYRKDLRALSPLSWLLLL